MTTESNTQLATEEMLQVFAWNHESDSMESGFIEKERLVAQLIDDLHLSAEYLHLNVYEMADKAADAAYTGAKPSEAEICLCAAIKEENWRDLPSLYDWVFEGGMTFLDVLRSDLGVETRPVPDTSYPS